MEGKESVYHMNPVSQINRKGRAEILRTSGAGFDQKGSGGVGGRGTNLCVETANILQGDILYLTVWNE